MRSPPNNSSSRNATAVSKYRPFCYDNLNEDGIHVRLLKVHPKRKGQSLRCDLQTIDLTLYDGQAAYSALSYAWGLSREQKVILVNGKTLKIHSNLHEFLDTAATHYPGVLLWIDAICIDQNNLLERNHQVQLMNEIYSRAETVMLWLGKHDDLLLQGFEAVSHCFSVHPVIDDGQWDQFDEYFWHYESLFEQLRARLWDHIYWTRVWVVQEILLGNPRVRVLYGHHNIPWTVFVRVIEILSIWESRISTRNGNSPTSLTLLDPCPTRFVRLCSAYHNVADSVSAVLQECSVLNCSDKRDRVYGVLSLLPDGTSFPVDYLEDRFDLFCRFCTHFDLWHSESTVATLFSGLIGSTLSFGVDMSSNDQVVRQIPRCRKKKVHLSQCLFTQKYTDGQDSVVEQQNRNCCCASCGSQWPMDYKSLRVRSSFVWCSKPCEIENSHTHLVFQSISDSADKLKLVAVIISYISAESRRIMLSASRKSSQQAGIQSKQDHSCSDLTEMHVGQKVFTLDEKASFDYVSTLCEQEQSLNVDIQVLRVQSVKQAEVDIADSFTTPMNSTGL